MLVVHLQPFSLGCYSFDVYANASVDFNQYLVVCAMCCKRLQGLSKRRVCVHRRLPLPVLPSIAL